MTDLTIDVHVTLPFTEETKRWLAENGPDPLALCSEPEFEKARERGVDRVLQALERAEYLGADDVEGLYGYFFARMIVSHIKDKWLVGRFALSEAVHLRQWLLSNSEHIPRASFALGIPIFPQQMGDYEWHMHFTDYLVVATAINDEHWKLATQPMKGGYVYMTTRRATRVIQEAYREKINRELPRDVKDYAGLLDPFAKPIIEKLRVVRPEEGPATASVNDTFPPCVNAAITALADGVNVPHTGRFLVAAFLNGINVPSDEIQACFVNAPDYDAETTATQIASIKSKGERGYTPPTCATLRSQGLCHADDFCRSTKPDGTPRVTNPMHYYRAKTWRGDK